MSAGTIARTIILALALLNQILVISGKSPLPIEDGQIEILVSTAWTVIASLVTYWKNNSWTKEAKLADKYMNDLKLQKQIFEDK